MSQRSRAHPWFATPLPPYDQPPWDPWGSGPGSGQGEIRVTMRLSCPVCGRCGPWGPEAVRRCMPDGEEAYRVCSRVCDDVVMAKIRAEYLALSLTHDRQLAPGKVQA